MSEVQGQQEAQDNPGPAERPMPQMQPGFCSATCTDKPCLLAEIGKPPMKTSDVFTTCNLPKRFENPHWFNGYGCQVSKQHPFYRTTANEYGYYAPGIHSVVSSFFPMDYSLSKYSIRHGNYRNYSLNTQRDTTLKTMPCSDK